MGNGVGTDLQGPLAQMWRDVYAKSAGVAEARSVQLLKEHVYQYPHGAGGGGGGGGGWDVLAEHEVSAPAGELSVRLPASGSLPQTYATLVLEVRARSTATGTTRDNLTLQLNAEAAYTYYYNLTRNDNGTVDGFGSPNDSAWDVGGCPKAGAAAGNVGTTRVWLPMYARTDAKKTYLSESETGYGSGTGSIFTQVAAGWAQTTEAISALYLRPGLGSFGQGSLVRLWGVRDAGGGGGGGTGADVTITADASIAVTEAPANTFALATRISADAGNALSLHANGLFSTDTTGGGGTGNTTMYTQSTAPTGATNSLWFNPSDAA